MSPSPANTSTGSGGAVFTTTVPSASLTMTHCTFTGNKAEETPAAPSSSTALGEGEDAVTDSTFHRSNTAAYRRRSTRSAKTVRFRPLADVVIRGNSASENGGGIKDRVRKQRRQSITAGSPAIMPGGRAAESTATSFRRGGKSNQQRYQGEQRGRRGRRLQRPERRARPIFTRPQHDFRQPRQSRRRRHLPQRDRKRVTKSGSCLSRTAPSPATTTENTGAASLQPGGGRTLAGSRIVRNPGARRRRTASTTTAASPPSR